MKVKFKKAKCHCITRNDFNKTCLNVVKLRRMRWAGHVARMGGGESCA